MTERPILFSGPMVRAILDGRKTMTRRVVKHPPFDPSDDGLDTEILVNNIKCPYGQPGDRLWVRETWSPWADESTKYAARSQEPALYCADYKTGAPSLDIGGDYKWHPSIYMPRWASRITLDIVAVRVERLQEISVDDVIAEGILRSDIDDRMRDSYDRWQFRQLWDSINAKRGYSWDLNPWVWVIGFTRV